MSDKHFQGGPFPEDGSPMFERQPRERRQRARSILDDLLEVQAEDPLMNVKIDPDAPTFGERRELHNSIDEEVASQRLAAERQLANLDPTSHEVFEARLAIGQAASDMHDDLRRRTMSADASDFRRSRRAADAQDGIADDRRAQAEQQRAEGQALGETLWSEWRQKAGDEFADVSSAEIERAAEMVARAEHYGAETLKDPEMRDLYFDEVIDELRKRPRADKPGPGVGDLINQRLRSDGFS